MNRTTEHGIFPDLLDDLMTMCPCPIKDHHRFLEEEDSNNKTWEIVCTLVILFLMFVALISDRIGADSVMLSALTAFMALEIVTVQEGLQGFANQGLLTILVLFIVAEGISRTGALDWYMGKLLGSPESTASAQLRLMAPIAIVSAFLNNTPVVAVMIPIVQRWGKNIGVSPQQLLIPLSFASILGGTCTLIGTSTNLVVEGLLKERYPDDASLTIGLFSLGEYGVPIAIIGMTYILLVSPYLIPGASGSKRGAGRKNQGINPFDYNEEILMGAKLKPWSPAAGRSVKRSGLRDTGGIYLVSVHRAATGNIHRAVGQEFVLNVGDVLYFTGLVEGFVEFCEEYALELVTNEVETPVSSFPKSSIVPTTIPNTDTNTAEDIVNNKDHLQAGANNTTHEPLLVAPDVPGIASIVRKNELLSTVHETKEDGIPCEIGMTKESLIWADEDERTRSITRMTDLIRSQGKEDVQGGSRFADFLNPTDPPKIVTTIDGRYLVVVAINSRDRPGLLLDISRGLLRLNLQLRHTEAAVVSERSLSIWRCEPLNTSDIPDIEGIWSVLNALLQTERGIEAVKKRGLRVVRGIVTDKSTLIGRTAAEADFRRIYQAAIIAVQQNGGTNKNSNQQLSNVRFAQGDILILQTNDDSPLLLAPPKDFYKDMKNKEENGDLISSSSVKSLVDLVIGRQRTPQNDSNNQRVSFPSIFQRTGNNIENVKGEKSDSNNTKNKVEKQEKNDRHNDQSKEVLLGDNDTDFYIPVENVDEDSKGYDDDGSLEEFEDNRDEEVGITASINEIDTVIQEAVWKDLEVLVNDENDKETNEAGRNREFLTAMQISKKSNLSNKTVAQVGISKLSGIFLVSIERPIQPNEEEHRQVTKNLSGAASLVGAGGDSLTFATLEKTFTTISPDEPLKDGDVLWFAGSASAVGDLRKIPGLLSYENEEVQKIEEKVYDRRLVQAVIAKSGPLVGKTVKDARFRTRYGAAVIAVHRDGDRVHELPGRIRLLAGDVLLLEAGSTFIARSAENDRSFALLAEVKDSAPPRLALLIPALLITAGMLLVYTIGITSLLVSALVASIAMIVLGILSEQEARDAVNWEIYIIIASAFGIGIAMENSGVASIAANLLVSIGEAIGFGDAGLFGAVYFATFLISNVVTNNAAAALLFPVALDAAEATGTDLLLMSYCLMLGASASFMSPFGYTTNLLIYGPGGYKYTDFLVVGTPMQIVLWIVSVLILSLPSLWWVNWIATSAVFGLVVATRVCTISIKKQETI